MGLFDTLFLEPALICPRCGKQHDSVQTKLFENTMSHIRVGMFISGSPIHIGIIKETIWCCPGPKHLSDGHPDNSLELWLIIWHGIFAGYALDTDAARQKLDNTDRLDLLGWMSRLQQEREEWKSRYSALHYDLRQYLEYRDLPAQEKVLLDDKNNKDELKAAKRTLHRISLGFMDEEIIHSSDPLRAICTKHGPEQAVDHGFFGWD